MKKKLLTLTIYLLVGACSYAQTCTISGFVREINRIKISPDGSDRADTNASVGTSVFFLKDSVNINSRDVVSNEWKGFQVGSYADADGYFSFSSENITQYKYIWLTSIDINEVYDIDFNCDSNIIFNLVIKPTGEQQSNIIYKKPAIYLYPTKTTEITVLHDFKGEIGTTFPDYNDGWQVTAKPNGELRNKKDDRKYEYLFWDGIYAFPKEHYDFKSGFVVNSKDNVTFLLEKLTYIGLNEKEINDFMVYWLPMLNQNPINFIHFRINDNIDNSSVLKVSPEPDSWIRLFMEFKPVDASFSIPEQQLKNYPRKGFTLVEWGGGKIEQNFVFQ